MHEPSHAAIRVTVEPNERLLWSGRPGQRIRFWEMAGFAIWVYWTYAIVYATLEQGFHLVSIPLVLAGLVGVGLIGIMGPYRRARFAYGVTDQRVLLVYYGFRPRTEAYELRGMAEHNVLLKGAAARGTVRFADFAQRCGYEGRDLCMPEFSAIPDAAHVVDLIRTTILTIRQQGKAAPRIVRPTPVTDVHGLYSS
jgi:hypothetical protein